MRLSLLFSGLILLCSACLSGCGGPASNAVEVTGIVYYLDPPRLASNMKAGVGLNVGKVGKPISGAKVTFHEQGEPIGYGITDGLGRFRIRTYYHLAEPIDGLPLGMYAVTITKLSLIETSPSDRTPEKSSRAEQTLPSRYSDPATTEWKAVEVKSAQGIKNHFRLTVSGQARRQD